MENENIDAYRITFRNSKPHQDREKLAALIQRSTPSQICKHLHISAKLLDIKLREFKLT